MNHNLSALVFQECCHTRQKWNLWVCGFVSVCCVCISKHVPICVFSYPHLRRRHTVAPLTPDSLFVLQFSLIFSLCGQHVQFRVVTHTHIFVITLGLKVKCTHFHIHTRAGQHVLNLFCARIVLCPFVIVSTFAWEGTSVKFDIVTDIFAVSRCDWESKIYFDLSFYLSVCRSSERCCHVSLCFTGRNMSTCLYQWESEGSGNQSWLQLFFTRHLDWKRKYPHYETVIPRLHHDSWLKSFPWMFVASVSWKPLEMWHDLGFW